MKFWYILELVSRYDPIKKKIGESISAEVVKVLPRGTSGECECTTPKVLKEKDIFYTIGVRQKRKLPPKSAIT